MKYIKIEQHYHDIDELSMILGLPSSQIEEIVDKGVSFLTDAQEMNCEINARVDILRLVARLLDRRIEHETIRQIIQNSNKDQIKSFLESRDLNYINEMLVGNTYMNLF